MAKIERSKFMKFFIVNIKLRNRTSKEDLKPSDYIRLFRKIVKDKIHEESSPTKHCIFRVIFEEKENGIVRYMYGTFVQFTYINNDKWINIKSLDFDEEFKAPDGLFPDAKSTQFVFIPSTHRFCYNVSSDFNVSPYSIKKFLEKSLDKVCNVNEYVQVDVESDTVSVEKILAAQEIKKILIDVTYSNSDFAEEASQYVEDDIRLSNTSRLKIEATQKPKTSIDIMKSKILSGAMMSSISNGETEAVIINEHNQTETIKTTNFPKKESVYGVSTMFSDLVYNKIIKLFKRDAN